MADPTWPAALPRLDVQAPTVPDTTLRSPMAVGPAKVRSLFSAAPIGVTGRMIVNGHMWSILFGFYLANRATPFIFEDPFTDAPVRVRFTGPPQPTQATSGDPTDRLWEVKLSLEVLP